jgi:hypothetical protein
MSLLEPPASAAAPQVDDMTRALWDTAPSAQILLDLLGQSEIFERAKVASLDRQLRLFAAWCARRTSPLLSDNRSRRAIQVAELFAAGSATLSDAEHAQGEAELAVREIAQFRSTAGVGLLLDAEVGDAEASDQAERELARACAALHAAYAASHCAGYTLGVTGGIRVAVKCAEAARTAVYWSMVAESSSEPLVTEKLEEEDRRQAEALRTFIGNPFDTKDQPPLTLPARSAEATPRGGHVYYQNDARTCPGERAIILHGSGETPARANRVSGGAGA